jgi:predicted lipoprotein with Yx(FWY)xxD motif
MIWSLVRIQYRRHRNEEIRSMAYTASTETPAAMGIRRCRRLLTLGLIPVAGVLAAACGSSGGGAAAPTTTAATSASAPTTAIGPPPVVTTKSVGSFGKILVNSQGQVLYSFTSNGVSVPCNASCLAVWPAVTLPSGTAAPTGSAGVGTLGTTTANGPLQVTENGLPLYTYAGDSAPGVANGNNLVSFGGTWKVVKAQ